MKDREKEYKEIFIAEALQEYDEISRHIVELEKKPEDEKLLAEIFRLLHNMKANANAMGYTNIGELAHKLESVFSSIRNKEVPFKGKTIPVLFEGIDFLGYALKNIDNPNIKDIEPELLSNLENISHIAAGKTEVKPTKRYYTSQNVTLSELIYIQVKKLDDLLNLVGELVIDRDRIIAISKQIDNFELKQVTSHLYRITADIQQSVMNARLVNIGALFTKFHRIVRDVAVIEGKAIELHVSGQDIQIDRNILQIITDSLLHLVRNSITHGIESEKERLAAGKPAHGNIYLTAYSDKDTVVIEVEDDGQGIDVEGVRQHAIANNFISEEKNKDLSDPEVLSLIFEPGFSLAKQVSEISGRGVGLDIVKNAIDVIGGKLQVNSERGKGTIFILTLPTSIAVKGALLFEVDNSPYAIPLIHIDSVVTMPNEELHQVGQSLVADIKGETIPVIYLNGFFSNDSFGTDKRMLKRDLLDIIIVVYNNRKMGMIVDKLIRQQDIVVKPLQKPVESIDIFSGVTLLGTGEVCLVMDIPSLSKKYITRKQQAILEES